MVRTYQHLHGCENSRVGPASTWSTEKAKMLDDTVTLTKSQLRAILQAVGTNTGDQRSNDIFYDGENHFEENKRASTYSDRSPIVDRRHVAKRQYENVTKTPAFHDGASSYSDCGYNSLSRLEQKKLQWEREKAEKCEWAPWGRPGGGAPRQFKNENIPAYRHNDSRKILPSENGNSGLPSPEPNRSERVYSGYSSLSNSLGRHVQDYIRSSVPFGPNSNDTREKDELKKRLWQEDLKNQREEQKLKREELNRWYSEENGEYPESHYNPTYSNPVSPLSSLATSVSKSHHRGQGTVLDPDELSKLEEKRQKALEYNQIIQAQVDDKRRRELKERERQRLEEEKEERRLEDERERLREQYEEEQRRLKEKQDEKERKERVLLLAIKEAQASAEKARFARRKPTAADDRQPQSSTASESRPTTARKPITPSRKAESRNSNFSELAEDRLPSTRSSSLETERWVASSLLSEPLNERVSSKPQQTVRPVQSGERLPISAPLPEPTNRESAVQTVRPASAAEEKSPYVRNRLLTPSQWRMKERNATVGPVNVWGTSREFGTQTDVESVDVWPDDREYAASSGSSLSSASPKHRVQHAKTSTKASISSKNSEAGGEKPKWGVNKPEKSFVKMTDRDPHYYRHKKMQDLRKQHWEREMATQRTLTEARRLSSRQDGNARMSAQHVSNTASSSYRPGGVPWRSDSSVLNHRVLNATYTITNDLGTQFPVLHRRWSHSTDNIQGKGQQLPDVEGSENLPPVRRKWRSQETFFPPALAPASGKKSVSADTESIPTPRRKWSDQDSFDPEHVALLQAMSRRGDADRKSSASSNDPISNPELVKKRPTPRQDKILQQLSTLRQGLLQKQKEIDGWLARPPRTAS